MATNAARGSLWSIVRPLSNRSRVGTAWRSGRHTTGAPLSCHRSSRPDHPRRDFNLFRQLSTTSTSSAAPSPRQEEEQQQQQSPSDGTNSEVVGKPAAAEGEVIFVSEAKMFFRLLATASSTQIAFWASYQALPLEILTSNPYAGYIGVVASSIFGLIARHFAHHYVSEVAIISPTAFRVKTYTFWGNKGNEEVVQIGSVVVQESKRYYAFKVRGHTFYHLCDILEGEYTPPGEEGQERLRRLLWGLKVDGPPSTREGGGEDGGERDRRRLSFRDRRRQKSSKR